MVFSTSFRPLLQFSLSTTLQWRSVPTYLDVIVFSGSYLETLAEVDEVVPEE